MARANFSTDILYSYASFTTVSEIPEHELCSKCFVDHYGMMMTSPYSYYNKGHQKLMDRVYSVCGKPDKLPLSTDPINQGGEEAEPFCLSNVYYNTTAGDTCDTIALAYNVSSAALAMGNRKLSSCKVIQPALKLCIPLSCNTIYTLAAEDTCKSIEAEHNMKIGQLQSWNPWIMNDCSNLHTGADWLGKTICMSPQGGLSTVQPPEVLIQTPYENEYAKVVVPPPIGATVAPGTATRCGKWHTATDEDTCTLLCMQNKISLSLFVKVNPTLLEEGCSLIPKFTFCTKPVEGWEVLVDEDPV